MHIYCSKFGQIFEKKDWFIFRLRVHVKPFPSGSPGCPVYLAHWWQ